MDAQLHSLAQQVGSSVDDRRVATAESCTAGLVAQALATGERASAWFLGGVVSYHRDVKYDILDVPHGPVVNHGAAQAMATGVARLLGADAAVSVTGAAGPDGQDGVEPGTVFLGFVVDGRVDSEEHRFGGGPERVCEQAARGALAGLAQRLAPDAAQLASSADEPASASSRSTSSSST
jgi:nicotinamide-nucleotide amidase